MYVYMYICVYVYTTYNNKCILHIYIYIYTCVLHVGVTNTHVAVLLRVLLLGQREELLLVLHRGG